MNYVIEKMNLNNLEDYARVSALAWKQSYNGIINNDFLDLINTEAEIKVTISHLKDRLKDGSERFLLKYNNKYVGILRVRKTKYKKYKDCGELGALYLLASVKGKGFGKILFNKAKDELRNMGYNKMILGCISSNSSNNFYKHMGGNLIDTSPLVLANNQELIENLYLYNL